MRWSRISIALCCALGSLSGPSVAHALNTSPTTHAYGIAKYTKACGVDDHSVHEDTATTFYQVFKDLSDDGDWGASYKLLTNSVTSNLFTDSSSTCADCKKEDTKENTGADYADVFFIHSHGGRTSPSGSEKGYTRLYMSQDGAGLTCTPDTKTHMRFGQAGLGDLEVAVVKTCQSADFDVWKAGGYDTLKIANGQFRIWNGFHGDSSCGESSVDHVASYAESSIYNGIGENWVDEFYDNAAVDDCPASIVFGADKTARKNYYANGGFKDRIYDTVGSNPGSSMFYIGGCKPTSGSRLPAQQN